MKRKRINKGKTLNLLLNFFLLILTGLFVFSNIKIAFKRKEIEKEIEELEKEISRLNEENAILKQGIEKNKSEEYWEEKLREQGYKKPGEVLVIIKKEETKESAPLPQSFWNNIIEEIRGIFY